MICKTCKKEVYGKQIAKGTGLCKDCWSAIILPVAGYVEDVDVIPTETFIKKKHWWSRK